MKDIIGLIKGHILGVRCGTLLTNRPHQIHFPLPLERLSMILKLEESLYISGEVWKNEGILLNAGQSNKACSTGLIINLKTQADSSFLVSKGGFYAEWCDVSVIITARFVRPNTFHNLRLFLQLQIHHSQENTPFYFDCVFSYKYFCSFEFSVKILYRLTLWLYN